VLRVPATDVLGLATRVEAFAGVRADRLEHREARLAVGLFLLAEHVVVNQRRQVRQERVTPGDGFGSWDRAAAVEDREPREEGLLVRAEQVVAPVDGRTECLLARRHVSRPTSQEVKPLLESGEQRLRWEQLDPCGSEFDREWESVEANADLSKRRRVRVADGEVCFDSVQPSVSS
jgi:hypothetical protein